MTGTNCDLFTHNQSRSYLNHLVLVEIMLNTKKVVNSSRIVKVNFEFTQCLVLMFVKNSNISN
jgi:hypothetical protein